MSHRVTFLTIARAAHALGVSQTTLRNWERWGLISPARSQGRYRLYAPEVLKAAKEISYLRKSLGLNTAGIAHFLKSKNENGQSKPDQKEDAANVSKRLLRLRKRKNLTLSQVAREAGISVSFLSAIERQQSNPSIATLQKLSVIYDTNVRSFFGEKQRLCRLVHPRQRRVLEPHPGVRIEQLASGDTQMDPEVFRISPGASSGGSYHHDGEEFIYMLQGRLEIWLDDVERYVLEPGDCLYFESTHAHRWKSLSKRETVLIWCNTPPTF